MFLIGDFIDSHTRNSPYLVGVYLKLLRKIDFGILVEMTSLASK